MADHTGLKLVGLLFASVTLAVMLTAAMMVKGHADGRYIFDAGAYRAGATNLTNN